MSSPPSSPPLFVGFDGGGSSTRALIASADGQICGFGTAGPSNPHDVGVVGAREQLALALANAWKTSAKPSQPFSGIFIGLAGGASAEKKFPHLAAELTENFPRVPGARVALDHDLRNALAGAIPNDEGIVVISGTGSAAYGRTASGRSARSGGWGPFLDDVGSGYWLGRKALRFTARVLDGRAPPSLLSDLIKTATQAATTAELLAWTHQVENSRPLIAKLAEEVFAAERRGDSHCRSWIQSGAEELVGLAMGVKRQLDFPDEVAIAFLGGTANDADYDRAFEESLRRTEVRAKKIRAAHDSLIGAWKLAAHAAGAAPSDSGLLQISRAVELLKK